MKSSLKTSSFAKAIDDARKIPLRSSGRQIFLPIDHVEHIQAARNYSIVYSVNGKAWVTSKTLQNFDELLNASNQFVRLHRSYLVNMALIVDFFWEAEGFVVLLRNHKKIRVSRRNVKQVRQLIVSTGAFEPAKRNSA